MSVWCAILSFFFAWRASACATRVCALELQPQLECTCKGSQDRSERSTSIIFGRGYHCNFGTRPSEANCLHAPTPQLRRIAPLSAHKPSGIGVYQPQAYLAVDVTATLTLHEATPTHPMHPSHSCNILPRQRSQLIGAYF
ncbi:uncharacterized protein LOC119395683 isoform X2 [Rhipicephalus sanguineus]|uniref:uncharacterized protein LOC119395683 isoform X2 n=1 Tax=Rhipicephalus sanguineus TaxID=34632 RepID=UPI0018959B62|nr:uncharacterized protein LOC119395683 isoform X2 [Rhipicephalus sanguineus]